MLDMRQQINLYQPTFRKRDVFSAGAVAAGVTLVIAGLAAFTWNEHRQVANLEARADSLRVAQAQRQAALLSEGPVNAAETAEQLEERVKRLKAEVVERHRAVQMLRSGAAGRNTGFAQRLDALARRHVDGLWLDQIIFSGTDGTMSLRGTALGADVVAEYLRNLATDSALSGARFDDFLIERPGKRPTTAPQQEHMPDDVWRAPAGSVRFRAASKSLQELSEKAS
jgi:hypothetical protein